MNDFNSGISHPITRQSHQENAVRKLTGCVMQWNCVLTFLSIFILLVLIASIFVYYSYSQDVASTESVERIRDQYFVELNNSAITDQLEQHMTELYFLTDLVNSYMKDNDLERFSRVSLKFIDDHVFYDQLQFIDNAAKLRLHIISKDNVARLVPASDTTSRNQEKYFKAAKTLDKGQMIVFPVVDSANNDNEQRVLFRIATPVINIMEEKRGLIILDYSGDDLLKVIDTHGLHKGRQLVLLESDGHQLAGNGIFGNHESEKTGAKLTDFPLKYPAVWQKISANTEGQAFTADGVFSWRSLSSLQQGHNIRMQDLAYPLVQKSLPAWKIVLLRDEGFIDRQLASVKQSYAIKVIPLLVVLGIISLPLTYLRLKQQTETDNKKLLQEAQTLTNRLIQIALTNKNLEQAMEDSLESILSISWLSILAKGSIFLLDEESNELTMVAQQDLCIPLLTSCSRLPIGKCLCGQAAERKQMIFTNCLDHQHEIMFEGIEQHGHICVPILKDDKLMGVLNMYVEHGHRYNPLYDQTLKVITTTLASVIERKRLDDDLRQVHKEIRMHRDALATERSIIEDTLTRIRHTDDFDTNGMRYLLAPVESTAGDILLSASTPDGIWYIMLGDFTGHGLSSALAGPTVADTFYAMTKRGLSPVSIITEINAKLCEKLPANIFLAASFIAFNPESNGLTLWNAGLPELVLFRHGELLDRFQSKLLALGIIEDLPLDEAECVINLEAGDHLYVYTDGVIEASGVDDQIFGQQQFEALLSSIITENRELEAVIETLEDDNAGYERHDDITVFEIRASQFTELRSISC